MTSPDMTPPSGLSAEALQATVKQMAFVVDCVAGYRDMLIASGFGAEVSDLMVVDFHRKVLNT